jgi:hypothetical protein
MFYWSDRSINDLRDLSTDIYILSFFSTIFMKLQSAIAPSCYSIWIRFSAFVQRLIRSILVKNNLEKDLILTKIESKYFVQ